MKKGRILTLAVLVCAMTLALQSTASAVILAGGYTGPIVVKIADFDMGSIYGKPNGTPLDQNTVLDTPAELAGSLLAGPVGGLNGESTWGIAIVTGIYTPDYMTTLWSPSATSALKVMFYGEKDFFVKQIGATLQLIDGTGLRADMWETTTPAATPFNPYLGSAGRTAFDKYTGVTEGTKILSLASKAGFINTDGSFGGVTTEFESKYDSSPANDGNGSAYMEVVPGGSQNNIFDSNVFSGLFGSADVKLDWTIKANINPVVGDWLVKTNDPAEANIIPEPATIIIWSLLGALGLVVSWKRRRA